MFSVLVTCLSLTACSDAPVGSTANASETGVVLITGANRGLGLEFARQYTDGGWTVIGTARKPDQADDLKALGAEVLALDVTDRASVAALGTAMADRPIDMLINNAGIFPRQPAIADVDIDSYTLTLMVNTVGPVLITQALLPSLQQGKLKHIVNMTSQLASIENNSGENYGYRESKAALNMFTKSLAAELGPDGFICLAIHPGWVRTDMGGPNGRLSPEESVTAMREVIDNMTAADNGVFRAFSGEQVPW
ncbi:MAG: SDR family oxidoreductase [Pseudomonadota bacterium]